VGAHQLQDFPHAIAAPARFFETADGPADKLHKIHGLFEAVAATLCVLGLAWCRHHQASTEAVSRWEDKLSRGISLGTWAATARATAKAMTSMPHDPLARLVHLIADRLLPGIERYTRTRNDHAHGGFPRTRKEQEESVDDLERAAHGALDRLELMRQVKLGHVISTSSNGKGFLIELEVLAGHAEPFPTRRLPSPRPYPDGTVIAYHDGTLEFAVDLAPYFIWKTCHCGHGELFYLHKRKKRYSFYRSFSTGHQIKITGTVSRRVELPEVAHGFEPLGDTRMRKTHGWRALWPDLAPPGLRVVARLVDVVVAGVLAGAVGGLADVLGLARWVTLLAAVVVLALYEPSCALLGGNPGKRLLRIDVISIRYRRSLTKADAIRRALYVDLHLIFPPLAAHNLAWLLADPARQCVHDRRTSAVVVAGRPRSPHGGLSRDRVFRHEGKDVQPR
jgi:hypothetical protein